MFGIFICSNTDNSIITQLSNINKIQSNKSLFVVMEKYGSLMVQCKRKKYMGASIQTLFYNLSGINLYEHTTKAYLIRMNSLHQPNRVLSAERTYL